MILFHYRPFKLLAGLARNLDLFYKFYDNCGVISTNPTAAKQPVKCTKDSPDYAMESKIYCSYAHGLYVNHNLFLARQ